MAVLLLSPFLKETLGSGGQVAHPRSHQANKGCGQGLTLTGLTSNPNPMSSQSLSRCQAEPKCLSSGRTQQLYKAPSFPGHQPQLFL